MTKRSPYGRATTLYIEHLRDARRHGTVAPAAVAPAAFAYSTRRWLAGDSAADTLADEWDELHGADATAHDATFYPAPPAAPAPTIRAPFDAMSDRQRSYLADLIRTRGDELHRELDLDVVDRVAASRLIDELRVRPLVVTLRTLDVVVARPAAPAPEPLPVVADGRYAIELDGAVRFYRLNTHDKSGRQYLDAQASDDFWSVTTYALRLRVLSTIAADPTEAMRRYGTELGKCGNCGRTLTDETSRAFGIGPDCRAKLGAS